MLAYTTGDKYEAFFRWWVRFLAESTDPERGVVCPLGTAGPTTEALYECLGGGMATHGIQLVSDSRLHSVLTADLACERRSSLACGFRGNLGLQRQRG